MERRYFDIRDTDAEREAKVRAVLAEREAELAEREQGGGFDVILRLAINNGKNELRMGQYNQAMRELDAGRIAHERELELDDEGEE